MLFDELYAAVKPAVLRKAASLKGLGYTKEDCLQEAALKVVGLLTTHDEWNAASTPYAVRAVLNHLEGLRRTRTPCDLISLDLDPVEETHSILGFDAIEWKDAIDSAPGQIGQFLRLRISEQKQWDQCCRELSLSQPEFAGLRTEAALWLLLQLEGR